MSAAKRANAENVSLRKFVRDKAVAEARKGCVICKLPPEVRSQLGRPATRAGFTREDQVAWLKERVGCKAATLEALAVHLNGKHDAD